MIFFEIFDLSPFVLQADCEEKSATFSTFLFPFSKVFFFNRAMSDDEFSPSDLRCSGKFRPNEFFSAGAHVKARFSGRGRGLYVLGEVIFSPLHFEFHLNPPLRDQSLNWLTNQSIWRVEGPTNFSTFFSPAATKDELT